MISTRRLLPLLVALLIWGHLQTASASPSNATPSSSKPVAPSSVMIHEAGARKRVENQRGRDPPGSPVNLFTPDEFQFYTLNGDGQLVMKQMTKQEIQGMIAAGGGGLPVDLGHHLTQLPSGEPEVSEVVENVQKVLKGELNRPVPVHTASSSIPGSINSQWTNMLPYILSGGSVDQQDVVQDTNVILPALESEQSYVDVIPLQNGKPAESQSELGPYYVPMSTTEEQQENKFMTLKPVVTSTEKPIYLLGNMALDSGILGEQDTYSATMKKRPTRPTINAVYQKFTTTRPSLDDLNDDLNNIGFNVKNNSDGKPTLYIPLSVSPSLINDAQKQDNYGHLGGIGVDKIPDHIIKHQEKNATKSPTPGISTFGIPLNKTPITVYPDDSGYTRVPMIQVPVISVDEISTSTQRTSQQQTPMFEILPTISPGFLTSTTVKEGSHPLKVNLGPIGGFKKPDTTQKTTITYHPVYNPTSKISTSSTTKGSTVSTTPATYRPIYQPVNKPSTTKLSSSTYRPVYDAITKTNTAAVISTSRPAYESPTKESTTKIALTSTYRPVYKPDTKPTTVNANPINTNSPVFETSTSSREEIKVTRYPANMYTTGKASSPVPEFVTKPSTQSEGLKVTKHPNDVTDSYATKKVSSLLTEIVTKPAVQIDDSKVTKYPISAQETTIKNEVLVTVVEQLPNDEKNPVITSTSQNTDKYVETTAPVTESNDKAKTTFNVNYKLPERTTLENLYTTDDDDYNVYSTTVFNDKEEIKVSMTTIDQEAKTEGYTINEDPTIRPIQVDESSTKIITDNDSPSTQQYKVEESTTFKITNSAVAEDKTEKYNNTQLNENDLTEQSSTFSDDMPNTTESWIENETTSRFVPIKEDTTKNSVTLISTTVTKSTSNKEDTTVPPKNTESVTEYIASITMTVDPSEKNGFSKKPLNDSEKIIIVSNMLTHQEIDNTKVKISTISNEMFNTESTTKIFEEPAVETTTNQSDELSVKATTFAENNKYTTKVTGVPIPQSDKTSLKPLNVNLETTTENTTPIYTYDTEEMEDKITTFSYDTTVTLNHSKNPSTVPATVPASATTENKKQSDIVKNNITPVYEKVETITESVSSIDENTNLHDKNKYSFKEEELSTVKVIPVYDDDASVYNLPSENPSQFNTLYTVKPTNGQKPVDQATTTTAQSILSTKINPTETALPGLQETFNNYMKEHYETKLSTINYEDISMLTTYPPTITEEMSTNKIKLSSATPSTISTNTDTTKYQTNQQIDDELFISTPINEDKIPMRENIGGSFSTTKQPGSSNKNKTETPIIYLDVTSSNTDKKDSASLNGDSMNNSSMTIIKINKPVSEIEKVIENAPLPTNTPSTVLYTLHAQSKEPNNIASGLIAGYPTYSQVKPVTETVFSTATPEMISETKKPSINAETKTEESLDETTVMNYTSTHEKPTFTQPEDEDRYAGTTTVTTDVQNAETTMSNVLKTSNYDSRTETPTELSPTASNTKIPSQPEDNDEINTSFNPPLEKISDLINQLQNSPPSSDSMIGYDYSNGIATTIVPYEKFETIMTEHVPTTTDDTLTTIFENLSKTSLEAQNTTYVVLQTLPVNPSTKPIEISTEYTTRRVTTKEPTTIALTTESATSSDKPSTTAGTTTVLSIVKQPTTGKPYITSTYSTTKGSLENIQSTIDKSAGRINLEEEKTKVQMKPTEASKFITMKNKNHYSTNRRPIEGQVYTRKPTRPINKGTTPTTTKITTTLKSTTQYTTSKPTEDSKETNKWTLIPQKETTDKTSEVKVKEGAQQLNPQIVPLDHSTGAIGLDQSNKALDKDVAEFLSVCNELSFKFWMLANSDLNPSRSVTMSPFGMISTLAMIFLGARGLTSNQMNDILKLDDVVTFNPHLVFQNITDTVTLSRNQGIENAAFVRALFADRLKVRRIIPFYKEQTQQFYEGAVVDINFSTAGDILRRKTNLLIRKQTGGRIKDFLKHHTVSLKSPLTALSANVFQTSCEPSDASSDGRDGEMYFAVSQTVKQRKLVPIPAVVWKSGVSAGYEPSLDATAVALGDPKRPVSMIMVMPGQQGVTAPGDNLERLEYRLFGNPENNAMEKLLKVIIPRRVEVQMPKFSHRSIVNVTSALKKMGFDQLFTKTADLKGINGAGHDLYLAEMMQMNLFCTCGDDNKLGSRHLSETYPGTSSRHSRSWELNNDDINNGVYNLENNKQESTESSDKCEEDDTEDLSSSENPHEDVDAIDRINNSRQKIHKKRLRWLIPAGRRRCRNRRQAEVEKPRMKMDKPFLYLIRHNHSGLILHIGRFNPKNQS